MTPADRRAAARERQKRHRALERAGRKALRIETHYHRAIEALLRSERLTEKTALKRKNVEAALSDVIDTWVAFWHGVTS